MVDGPSSDAGAHSGTSAEPETTNLRVQHGIARRDADSMAIVKAELAHAPEGRNTSPFPLWRDRLSSVSAVGAGGLLGANARYLLGIWVADYWEGAFPWGTLLINVTGSFILGLYLTLITERIAGRATTRLFVATGFLGAYTTFSTFSYETARLIQTQHLIEALAYVAASLVVGLAATIAGIAVANAI